MPPAAAITAAEPEKSAALSAEPGPGEMSTWLNSPSRTRCGIRSRYTAPAGTTRGSSPATAATKCARL